MKGSQLLQLVCLAALWGGSFLFIRLAVPAFGPVPLSATRSLIATITLLPILFLRGNASTFRQYWHHILVIGLISTALPFSLLSLSTQYTSAGFASILNALTPLFSTLIAWAWMHEKLTPAAITGIGLGFIGVLVMVLDKETISSSFVILPIMAGLGATFLYGLTGNYSRRFLAGVSPLVVAAGCPLFSTLLLLPFAIWQWPTAPIPAQMWSYAVVLGVACTGVAFILYFHLLATVGVARTMAVTYLVPVFAFIWGYIFLAETITLKMLIGAALILVGIGLTTGKIRVRL